MREYESNPDAIHSVIPLQTCPLCGNGNAGFLHQDPLRSFFRCSECALIFADPATHPSPEEERARYETHENSPEDPEYRRFLSRLAAPLAERLGPRMLKGLDFGSGPGPTLSVMLEEQGYAMAIYDPFFANHSSVLAVRYDFVTCTETVEHFHAPAREWKILLGLLKPGGWLGIMTRLVSAVDAFAAWYYKNDPTHVCFFSRETFRFLAHRDGLALEFIGQDVILLRKPD